MSMETGTIGIYSGVRHVFPEALCQCRSGDTNVDGLKPDIMHQVYNVFRWSHYHPPVVYMAKVTCHSKGGGG